MITTAKFLWNHHSATERVAVQPKLTATRGDDQNPMVRMTVGEVGKDRVRHWTLDMSPEEARRLADQLQTAANRANSGDVGPLE